MGIADAIDTKISGYIKFDYENIINNYNDNNKTLDDIYSVSWLDFELDQTFRNFFKLEIYKRLNHWDENILFKNLDFILYFQNGYNFRHLLIEEPYEEIVEFREDDSEQRLTQIIANTFKINGCKIKDFDKDNPIGFINILPNYMLSVKGRIIRKEMWL